MKVLQIWIGSPSKDIKGLMVNVKNFCKKSDIEYILISETAFLRGKYTKVDYKKYVSNMLMSDSRLEKIWSMIPEGVENHQYRSDIIRFWYLVNNQDVLYIDSDAILHSKPSKSEINGVGSRGSKKIDHHILYSGKNNEVLKEILFEAINKCLDCNYAPVKIWMYSVLNKYRCQFKKIDTTTYSH